MGVFDPTFEELPSIVPIFPLPSAMLLPGGHLPLRIFEPRFVSMFDHALASNRIIGMIQPQSDAEDFSTSALFGTGCLGRITSFSETDEGHYMVTLTGLIRFDAGLEQDMLAGYRRLSINCNRFRADMATSDPDSIDHTPADGTILTAIRKYFEAQGYDADWPSLERTPRHQLTTTLAMLCPFDHVEKQALLEAHDHAERLNLLLGLMQMDSLGNGGGTEIN